MSRSPRIPAEVWKKPLSCLPLIDIIKARLACETIKFEGEYILENMEILDEKDAEYFVYNRIVDSVYERTECKVAVHSWALLFPCLKTLVIVFGHFPIEATLRYFPCLQSLTIEFSLRDNGIR